MADISKCDGKFCNKKESCYRFLAKESEYRQSYVVLKPEQQGDKCHLYWHTDELEKATLLKEDL